MMDAMRKGGNFLFNIGPDERGYVVSRDRDVLDELGGWIDRNREAIFATCGDSITQGIGQGACYQYGMFTTRGTTAYWTLFFYPRDYVIMSKVGGHLMSAQILSTGQELRIEPLANQRYRISGLPLDMPDPLAVVIKLTFEKPPHTLAWSGADWLCGHLGLVYD
jgi:alpha-L-fucosidase